MSIGSELRDAPILGVASSSVSSDPAPGRRTATEQHRSSEPAEHALALVASISSNTGVLAASIRRTDFAGALIATISIQRGLTAARAALQAVEVSRYAQLAVRVDQAHERAAPLLALAPSPAEPAAYADEERRWRARIGRAGIAADDAVATTNDAPSNEGAQRKSPPGSVAFLSASDATAGPRAHTAPAPPIRIAERDSKKAAPNVVIKVVLYGASGNTIKVWGAKGRWEGPLPQHFHGTRRGGAWTWDDANARAVRVNTRGDGTGGTSVEAWASQLHGTRVEIFAQPIDAVTERAGGAHEEPDTHAPGHAKRTEDAGDGSTERVAPTGKGVSASGGGGGPDQTSSQTEHGSGNHHGAGEHAHEGTSEADIGDAYDAQGEQLAADLEKQLSIDSAEDADAAGAKSEGTGPGHGHEGGSPEGRTGDDASATGGGPGGPGAKQGGGDKASESTRDGQGTESGDRDGEKHGSENGRFGGEGREGDDGVRGAGALFGGLIGVPTALQGAVELALLIEAGDIAGVSGALFRKGIGKAASVAAARRLVAREARIAAAKELRVITKTLATKKVFTALSKAERDQVLRIVYWEKQRQFFRAYLKAAKAEQHAVRKALKTAKPAQRAALEARRGAADLGEEIAKVEPVAGRLPQNHAYAGREFPRSELPPQYRKEGLKFKDTGYPDFEPYAKTLPNGKKKVFIEYSGLRKADEVAANKAAGLQKTPPGWIWHHDESELGAMYLVPRDLHQTAHTGGVAEYKHRHGVTNYD